MLQILSSFDIDDRFRELVINLGYLESLPNKSLVKNEEIDFVTPLSITPMLPIIANKSLKIESKNSYLNTICFPEGIKDIKKLNNLEDNKSTYLPIVCLNLGGSDFLLDKIASIYSNLISRNLQITDQDFLQKLDISTIPLLIGEMVDNIKDHSLANNVYLFAQYWPANQCVEFCLVDDGQGLFGSLKSSGRDVNNDIDALTQVIDFSLSSKKAEGEIHRGTGIRNTRRLLVNEKLKGEFTILSGKAAYIESNMSQNFSRYYSLTKTSFKGTMITCKFKKPTTNFKYTDYVTN